MSISFTFEARDAKAFIAHRRRYNPANRRLRYAMLFILGILSFQHAMRYQEPARRAIDFFVVLAIYIFVVWIVRVLLEGIRQWRSFSPKAQPGLFCEHTVTLTDDTAIETTHLNEVKTLWPGVHSVVNAPRYIYILVAANAGYIIPKRAFADPEAGNAFFNRAVQLWSDAKRSGQLAV